MRTREELATESKSYRGLTGGLIGITKMLVLVLEVLIDIRELLLKSTQ